MSVFAHAQSTVQITDFRFVELKGRLGHEGFFPIDGDPVMGHTTWVTARLSREVRSAALVVKDLAENVLSQTDLSSGNLDLAGIGEYLGTVQVPADPFRISVRGIDSNGADYDTRLERIFHSQTLQVQINSKSGELRSGASSFAGSVTNHGATDTFQLTVEGGPFSPSITPSVIKLRAGENSAFDVRIDVPLAVRPFTPVTIVVAAASTTAPSRKNLAVNRLIVVPAEFLGLPLALTIEKVVVRTDSSLAVNVKGSYRLSPHSNGIDPTTEGITVMFDANHEALPPGLFKRRGSAFVFKNKNTPGVTRLRVERHKFSVTLTDIDPKLLDFNRPIPFGLRIGDDFGETFLSRGFDYPFVINTRHGHPSRPGDFEDDDD